jgi:hypothetical protein
MSTGAASGSVLDGLLKNVYLPTLLVTAYNDHRFSDMIKQRSDVIGGGGNQIVHFALTQRAEGVGAIAEGGNWVNNVPIKGQQLTENVKYLNAYLELTGPVIKAANSGQKSAVDAVTKTVQTNIQSFKNYFDRICMGAADAKLGYVSGISGAALTVSKTSFPLAGYNADMFLPVGARCNVATFDTNGIASNGFCNANADDDYGFIIAGLTSRDTSAGTAVLDLHDEDDSAYGAAGTQDVAVADFLVREGSYGTPGTAAVTYANCLEPNGLSNLVSDGTNNSETQSNYTTCWGKTRTDAGYSMLQSYTYDFGDNDLSEDYLTDMLMDLKYSRQAAPNLLMVTPKAERQFFIGGNFQSDRRWPGVSSDFTGGYRSTSIQLEDVTLRLSSLGAVPAGVLFMINTNDFAFASNRGFEWVLGDGGQVLVQSHTGDNKFASAVQYMNFVCFDPYRQGKGYSVSES